MTPEQQAAFDARHAPAAKSRALREQLKAEAEAAWAAKAAE